MGNKLGRHAEQEQAWQDGYQHKHFGQADGSLRAEHPPAPVEPEFPQLGDEDGEQDA